MTQHVRRDRPERLCDVVMKGGITSGVVYPRAVSELAGTFRLKNVGGTSAGAIAAAVAAAAEFGREDGGFDELDALPGWLAQKGNLEGLFQPQESTSELYRVLLAGVRHRGAARVVAVIAAAVYWFLPASLVGALPGAALIWQARGAIGIVLGAAVALVGMVIAAAVAVARRATTAIPANRFGLCSGMPGLTPWLTDRIDAAARRPQPQGPLTFGELWAGPGGDPATADPADGWLRLEMVTTNVTNHRAEQLPSASREFFFDPDELADLFPKAVVAWMIDHPPPLSTQPARRRDQQLRRRLVLPLLPMPHAADLPVIVATRMSLSFPVLLSAVPLWRVDYTRRHNIDARTAWQQWLGQHPDDWEQCLDDPDAHLPDTRPRPERCWFSDGGISSNFPIHFFDAYLPRHPTVGIDLREFHPDHPPSGDQCENVWMPQHHPDGLQDWWYRFDGRLFGFLSNIVRTMQNRVDDAQARMPGYRDRVVHVSLTKREGGMNLDMDPDVIGRLTERGHCAGQRLVERFGEPPPTPASLSWDDHRWVRFRTLFPAMAEMLSQVGARYDEYEPLLDRPDDVNPQSYPMTAEQRDLAQTLGGQVEGIGGQLDDTPVSLASGSPSPRPALRVVPQDPPPTRLVDDGG